MGQDSKHTIVMTDEEYDLYNKFKLSIARDSITSLTSLEQDIDIPIKNCIMYLALLGCKPMWSCCGFDYAGQLLHKKHTKGMPYINCGYTYEGIEIMKGFCSNETFSTVWNMSFINTDKKLGLCFRSYIRRPDFWNDVDCIHFSELGATYIQYLENYLLSLKDKFAESALIEDTNTVYKKNFPNWQYLGKEPWLIRKSDLNL